MKLVCSKCKIELRPKTNGVKVVEYAGFGPYKIWEADEWECRNCGSTVITGFAQFPIAEHFQPNFSKILQELTENPQTKNLIRFDYEQAEEGR